MVKDDQRPGEAPVVFDSPEERPVPVEADMDPAMGQPSEMFVERIHPKDRVRLLKMIGQGIAQDIP